MVYQRQYIACLNQFDLIFQNLDLHKADLVSSNLSSPTGNNKYPKILDNVERLATVAQANGKQSSLNKISGAQEVDEPQNHKSTRNQDDLKVLNDTESSITVSEANDEESQVESVEKGEYLKALNNPGTSINIAGTDGKQSTPNRDSSAQEVSESQPNDSDENEVCLNIMNDTGTYVRIEVDDAVQVTINNVHSPQELNEPQICEPVRSPQELNEPQICEPVRKEEYAKLSNNEETLSTVAEGDGERYNFNKLTNKLEDSSRQELDKPNKPQSQEVTPQSLEGYREEECPKVSGRAGTRIKEIAHNNPQRLSSSKISNCFTKLVKRERTSIQEKVDEPIKGTPSKVPIKSISSESQTHIEKITRNNVTFTQKLSEYKLCECDLNIELEDHQRLTKRVKTRMDKRATGARKIRHNRALNTVEISTVEKVGFPTFQCSGQIAYPKRIKRTEMASDENADNAEASDEIQEPRAKRKKTQVSTEQEPSGSQVCECDCQEESSKQVIRVETPSHEDVDELLVVHNDVSGIKKPSPMFQCTGQVAYPKRMKHTEIDIDGNSDNLETVDNETQQPHAKRRKTQSESQMSDCDLQEEHPNHVNIAKTHISEKEDITQNKVSTTKEASESQVSEFEETYRKVFDSLCNQVASARKRSSILGCNRQVEHQKSALLMETPENADDPQVIQKKVPTSQTPSVSACASEHRDDVSALKTKRRKSSGFYTGDVSFARTVLERWIREHVSDGEDEN
ncbi:Hypothetical predicted protein [Paramuricea clavata]|uniref:Uncharacterized protein n=1 Tax=Paramuricea clavata TaxID=317549 RepID=A0A6S7JYQ3_PARCT|nr:Hypothetical predicted protein [Paramuricea clavata]